MTKILRKFRGWDEGKKVMHHLFQFIRSGGEGNDWILFTSDLQPIGGEIDWTQNPYFAQQFKITQFTGIIDKNGVEIYEGDILGTREYVRIVEWNDKWGSYALRWADSTANRLQGLQGGLTQDWIDQTGTTVLGNIFANPELLAVEGVETPKSAKSSETDER